MRKITQLAKYHFDRRLEWRSGNTRCTRTSVFLHDNKIISRTKYGGVVFSFAGYTTMTTRERISAFFPVSIKNGEPCLNGISINDEAWYDENGFAVSEEDIL